MKAAPEVWPSFFVNNWSREKQSDRQPLNPPFLIVNQLGCKPKYKINCLLGPYSQLFIFLLTYEWAQWELLLANKASYLFKVLVSYKENEVLGIQPRGYIHYISFSWHMAKNASYWENTLTYSEHPWVTKKMKCWEYCPWIVFTILHFPLNLPMGL